MSYRTKQTDRLFQAILSLRSVEECYQFFEDACTIKEMVEIAQRFEVARLLEQKTSYQSITKETGASSATIGRVNRCLMYGAGGYRLALERMERTDEN